MKPERQELKEEYRNLRNSLKKAIPKSKWNCYGLLIGFADELVAIVVTFRRSGSQAIHAIKS